MKMQKKTVIQDWVFWCFACLLWGNGLAASINIDTSFFKNGDYRVNETWILEKDSFDFFQDWKLASKYFYIEANKYYTYRRDTISGSFLPTEIELNYHIENRPSWDTIPGLNLTKQNNNFKGNLKVILDDVVLTTTVDILSYKIKFLALRDVEFLSAVSIRNSEIETITVWNSLAKHFFHITDVKINSLSIGDSNFNRGIFFSRINNLGEGRIYIRDSDFLGQKTLINIGDTSTVSVNLSAVKFNSRKTRFVGSRHLLYPFSDTDETKLKDLEFGGEVFFETGYDISKEVKGQDIRFREIRFAKRAVFSGALPNKIIFEEVIIEDEVDFTRLDPDTKGVADFCQTDAENIKLNFRNFELGRFNFFRPRNYHLKNDRKKLLNRELDRLETVYVKLLNKQKKEGLFESYKLLDLDYKRFQYFSMDRSSFWDGFYYIIAKSWWNFGYSKYRVLLWTILFLCLFTLLNYRKFNHLINKVYTIKNIKTKNDLLNKEVLGKSSYMKKKLELSFYYTAIIFFGIKLDNENFYYENFRSTVYIYFIYFLGLVCIAFILNYVISI